MIKYLVLDVDGTLTDGKIYMGREGEMVKAFNIKDGAGIALTLPKAGIMPVIITARESKILANRCKEIGIISFYQNVKDKLAKLKSIVGDDMSSVAYVGDDLPDIPCMEAVKNADGLVLAPADAIPEIRALANYVSCFNAGDGAIRDCINYLLNYNHSATVSDIQSRVQKVMVLILAENFDNLDAGDHCFPDGTKYNLQVYKTKAEEDCIIESHREHIDIQYVVSGSEHFKMYSTNCLTKVNEYDAEKDVEIWHDGMLSTESILIPGSMIVVYNGQPHKGAISNGESTIVKKVICKIKI